MKIASTRGAKMEFCTTTARIFMEDFFCSLWKFLLISVSVGKFGQCQLNWDQLYYPCQSTHPPIQPPKQVYLSHFKTTFDHELRLKSKVFNLEMLYPSCLVSLRGRKNFWAQINFVSKICLKKFSGSSSKGHFWQNQHLVSWSRGDRQTGGQVINQQEI